MLCEWHSRLWVVTTIILAMNVLNWPMFTFKVILWNFLCNLVEILFCLLDARKSFFAHLFAFKIPTTFHEGILFNTWWASFMLPHFAHMLIWLLPPKIIWLTTALNFLLMSTPALFKCNYNSTCIQQPHKSDRVHPFLLHFSKWFQCLVHLTTSHKGILWKNTPQASSMLPPLVCISTKQFPTETSESQLRSMICWCACLPALFNANNIQQLGPNMMGSGCTTSCCEHAFVDTSIAKPNNWSNLILIMPTKKC
jgi:hypothetical protein